MNRATRRQRAVLVAYLMTGSYKAAAKQLGMNENTARGWVSEMLKANGWENVAQAAFELGRESRRA